MNGRFTSPLLLIIFMGCVGVASGVPDLLFDSSGPWPKRLRIFGYLFAFGIWAGIVFLGEDDDWFPKQRRFINGVLFAGLVTHLVWQVSAPSPVTLLLAATVAGIAGFYGEKWLPHL